VVRAEPAEGIAIRGAASEGGMKPHSNVLVAVEDDPAFQVLIRATLGEEPEMDIFDEMPATVDRAIEVAREVQPHLIILDHNLDGEMIGLSTAPKLKEVAPNAKILLFTAYDIEAEARREPAVDAFLRKDDVDQLLPTSHRLLGLE
jgi:DNA-binding NarL/FixJ family response regulator